MILTLVMGLVVYRWGRGDGKDEARSLKLVETLGMFGSRMAPCLKLFDTRRGHFVVL